MDWVVTVDVQGKSHRYWVQADTQSDAEARGYRLHCASENYKANGADRVSDCKKVE